MFLISAFSIFACSVKIWTNPMLNLIPLHASSLSRSSTCTRASSSAHLILFTMISPSQQDVAQVESANFFQRTSVGSSDKTSRTIKMQKLLQDAHTLQKLAESYDIAHFLNKASATDDCHISDIAALAGNISQALDEMICCAPHQQVTKDDDAKPKRSKSPLTTMGSPKRCNKCGVTDTPRWRRSSPGCPRLCNVCSLVESKRAIRKHSKSRRASVSTRFSWPC